MSTIACCHDAERHYIGKIFRDLSVEQPTKCKRLINLKTTKALGPTIPQSLLPRADEVIP